MRRTISQDLAALLGAPAALVLVSSTRDASGAVVERWRSTTPFSTENREFIHLRTPAR